MHKIFTLRDTEAVIDIILILYNVFITHVSSYNTLCMVKLGESIVPPLYLTLLSTVRLR
jgi:hypothetical protein